ncbi:transmembrane protein 53-A [Zophobas morio]|uniref:transmembrane protein 53-A n=1 Tax=Zophobas morio TaxID=2755281 RepID=UPI003082D673
MKVLSCHSSVFYILIKPALKQISTMVYMSIRNISSTEITKNITILSSKKKEAKVLNFKLERPENKPLVVMLSWLLAKQKHIYKYADFYINRGFDVMNINITPWQMLWPLRGTQVVASDILKFLESNKSYSPIVIHGFSIGGYLWSEALVQIAAEEHRYSDIMDRIVGQVWDSLADITEIPEGFPFAIFPRNKMLQSTLRQYIIYHLKTFDKVATCHYIRASQMFHTNIIKAPALMFVSKSDPVGSEKSNLRVMENWIKSGISVQWKCWDTSPHVGHFHRYPDEYIEELNKFLDGIGLPWKENIRSSLQAKL